MSDTPTFSVTAASSVALTIFVFTASTNASYLALCNNILEGRDDKEDDKSEAEDDGASDAFATLK